MITYRSERRVDPVTKQEYYNIYSVPIFETFEDKSRKDVPKIDESDLDEIIQNFEQVKAQRKYLPRIHVGHHDDSTKNLPHAGYLGSLRRQGSVLFTDLVRIPPDRFWEIMQDFYPYRSVEYDPGERCIDGLALLQSRPPYHKLPIWQIKPPPESSNREGAFQKTNKFILYGKGFFSMGNPEDKTQEQYDHLPSEEPEAFQDDPPPEQKYQEGDTDKKEDFQDAGTDNSLESRMKGLEERFAKFEEQYASKKFEEPAPSSSVFQKQQQAGTGNFAEKALFAAFDKRLAQLEKNIATVATSQVETQQDARLRGICKKNNLNFEAERKHLMSLPIESREAHLGYISAHRVNFSAEHPATTFAKAYVSKEDKANFSKYGNFSKLAEDLHVAYGEAFEKSAQFQKAYPSREKFIEFFVEQEKHTPGYCKENLFN